MVTETKVLVHVTTENGTVINTTENHPFYVEGKGWCAATELEDGDVLRTQDGETESVEEVWTEQLSDAVRVYNLEIEESHTYYVSVDGVLVHNECTKSTKPEKIVNDLDGYTTSKWNIDGNNMVLDKKGMKHILLRHHPEYWNGSEKANQSFFDSKLSIDDIKEIISAIIKQNRHSIAEEGTSGSYQISGMINEIEYVLGLKNGRVGQLYPK